MKFKIFVVTILLIQIPVFSISAQNGTTDRDEYFRRMELRALELSRKMAELAGEEPIQIIAPRAEENLELQKPKAENKTTNVIEPISVTSRTKPSLSIQDSYDALPGPVESNKTSNTIQYEDKVGENSIFSQSTSEELKGLYYLKPSFVIQSPFDSIVSVPNSRPLKGEVGNGIGVVIGRRIENWTMSARFSHTHQEFSNADFLSSMPGFFAANGDVETLCLTGNIGVSVPLNQKLSFEASFGLGFMSVSHSLYMNGILESLHVFSDSGFSYELSMLLDYSFSERLSAFLGYRLAGIPENNGPTLSFDSVNAHLFELGVGLNF